MKGEWIKMEDNNNDNSCSFVLPLVPATTMEADCSDGDLQLVDGSNPLEGRVEICVNRAWGSICDSGFGKEEAEVICTQLASQMKYRILQNMSQPLSGAAFGEGRGPIFLEQLDCHGDESVLIGEAGCSALSPLGFHLCTHHQDAGVICKGINLL